MIRSLFLSALLLCTAAVAQQPAPPAQEGAKPADAPAAEAAKPAEAPPAEAAKPADAPAAAAKDAPAAGEAKSGDAAAAAAGEKTCDRSQIDKAIDDASAAIKSNAAYGHAAGNFKKAEQMLKQAKKAVEKGCAAYMKPAKGKGKAKAAKAKAAPKGK